MKIIDKYEKICNRFGKWLEKQDKNSYYGKRSYRENTYCFVADWNMLNKKFPKLDNWFFNKFINPDKSKFIEIGGAEQYWPDCSVICDNCGKIINTTPEMNFPPEGETIDDGYIYCLDCYNKYMKENFDFDNNFYRLFKNKNVYEAYDYDCEYSGFEISREFGLDGLEINRYKTEEEIIEAMEKKAPLKFWIEIEKED